MVAAKLDPAQASTRGHVAVYARDSRWRHAVARRLAEAGHSHHEAASPEELRRLIVSQRFDVLAVKARNEQDAREISEALHGLELPPHGILTGSAAVLPLVVEHEPTGTFRYVPGQLAPQELCRFVETSISAGTWEDGPADHEPVSRFEEVDLEETIESAASAVYAQAKRRRQRFSTVIEGPGQHAYADPARLRRSLAGLLRLMVTLAPRGSLISVEARAGKDEWIIRIRAAGGQNRAQGATQRADALREESRMLTSLSRDIRVQGGMLWVELIGPAALALCLTLPLPPEARTEASA